MKIKPLLVGLAIAGMGAGLAVVLQDPHRNFYAYGTDPSPSAAQAQTGTVAEASAAGTETPAAEGELLYTGFWRGSVAPDPDRMITVFFDPLCPHCNNLWDELKDVEVPQYWIPVAVLKNGESAPLGALLNTGRVIKPATEFETYFQQVKAGEVPAESVNDEEVKRVQRNTLEFLKTGQTGVPVIAMSGPDGKVGIIRGYVPKRTFLDQYEEFHRGKP